MGVVLELELLLLLARNGDPIVLVAGVQLAPGQLLRLESLLVPSAARRLSSLALTDSVLLRLFELAAIHVLRRVGGPRSHKRSVVMRIRKGEPATTREPNLKTPTRGASEQTNGSLTGSDRASAGAGCLGPSPAVDHPLSS